MSLVHRYLFLAVLGYYSGNDRGCSVFVSLLRSWLSWLSDSVCVLESIYVWLSGSMTVCLWCVSVWFWLCLSVFVRVSMVWDWNLLAELFACMVVGVSWLVYLNPCIVMFILFSVDTSAWTDTFWIVQIFDVPFGITLFIIFHCLLFHAVSTAWLDSCNLNFWIHVARL